MYFVALRPAKLIAEQTRHVRSGDERRLVEGTKGELLTLHLVRVEELDALHRQAEVDHVRRGLTRIGHRGEVNDSTANSKRRRRIVSGSERIPARPIRSHHFVGSRGVRRMVAERNGRVGGLGSAMVEGTEA
jgi:hypothetical protein